MSDSLSKERDRLRDEEQKQQEESMNRIKHNINSGLEQMDYKELVLTRKLIVMRKEVSKVFELLHILGRQFK